jgi:uncharacterized protein (DUF924 family)
MNDVEGNSPSDWVANVRRFWFEELTPSDWFSGRREVDEQIAARFGRLYFELETYRPDPALLTANGHLAAVIVFDQFPRNLFRNQPKAYATDAFALELANHAIALSLDKALEIHERHFLYMPFMHSEDREAQARALELFASLGSEDILAYAKHHKEIVDRFGRFPHRNTILGRTSTPAELEFLRHNTY